MLATYTPYVNNKVKHHIPVYLGGFFVIELLQQKNILSQKVVVPAP